MTDDMRFWRRPPTVRRDYFDGRFGQVHVRIARPAAPGKVPLLFIHSSPSSGRMWQALLAAMGQDRIALAADTPGFGDSDAPAAPPEIADYAAHAADVLDHFGITQADVMGYHTGSKVCVELALQRPGLVRRLVLVSAPIYTAEELARQKSDYAAQEIARDGAHLLRRWRFMMQWRKPDVPLWLMQRQFAESLKGGETEWWGHRAAFNYRHADHLPQVAQPVLVLNPDDDLTEQTRRAASILQNGRVVEHPAWSHSSQEIHTADYAQALRDFLDAPADDARVRAPAKPVPPRPAVRSAQAIRRRFIDGPTGQIHLRVAGEGKAGVPLFLFHMSPNSGRIWETIQAEMARDRPVVAIDTPGFGESDTPMEPPEIADYARTMAHVAATLGIGRIDVMGYHTGSLTAVETALQQPALVRKVVMVSAPFYTAAEAAARHARNQPTALGEAGTHLSDRFASLWQFYGVDVPAAVIARNFCESLRGGPLSWWGHRAAFNYDLAGRLPGVTHEILLLNPNDDLAIQTPRALALMQRGRQHDFPRYSHGMLDTHTAEIAAVLRGFLPA